MNPTEFQIRFSKSIGESPQNPGIEESFFRSFPEESINLLQIAEEDKRILREVGFPKDAAPFLSFTFGIDEILQNLSVIDDAYGVEFNTFKTFGHTGSGDVICIDESDGSIVYLNHDRNMERVFINSSLPKFAESLCLMAEAIESDYEFEFMNELAKVDPPAIASEAMWTEEYEAMKE
ncbi:MAG: SUKH-4 family immunity protein [Planctomycetota bacterium]|nr:SUKH-4 family immunity protein [Planctomycetota bacterium]